MRKIGLISSLLAIILLSACAFPMRFTEIKGSGNLVTETRRITPIDAVELSGVGTLIIEQGITDSLEITADENILKYIRSDVEGDTLKLGVKDLINILPSRDITYHLTVKDLSSVETSGMGNIEIDSLNASQLWLKISGTGKVTISNLQAQSFDLEISGMGDARVAGKVDSQSIQISGTGNYRAEALSSREADIKISGTGHALIWVMDSLNLDLSGTGDLAYYGEPVLNTSISGAGTLRSLGTK